MFAFMMRYGTDAAQKGWDDRDWPMMGDSRFLTIHMILGAITWLVALAVLVALVRWLWFKGDREKKSRR